MPDPTRYVAEVDVHPQMPREYVERYLRDTVARKLGELIPFDDKPYVVRLRRERRETIVNEFGFPVRREVEAAEIEVTRVVVERPVFFAPQIMHPPVQYLSWWEMIVELGRKLVGDVESARGKW